jgi:secreted trypsin-like serine protease
MFSINAHFNYQVQLKQNGTLQCGGSILNEHWIITAEHCFEKNNDSESLKWWTLSFGSSSSKEDAFIQRKISQLVHHDTADIAILKLDKKIQYQYNIQPICLPGQDDDFTGKSTIAILYFKLLHVGNSLVN